MAQPTTIVGGFSGMVRDVSRDALPGGAVWNLQDYFPNLLGAPLRKRGGWVYASSAVSGSSSIMKVSYGSSTSGTIQGLYMVDSSTASGGPVLWSVDTSTGVATSAIAVSASSSTRGRVGDIVYYSRYLIVGVLESSIDAGHASVRVTSNGTSFTTLNRIGGYLTIYKDRLVTSGEPTLRKRVFFSDAGDPTSFAASAYIDVSNEVTGLASLANAILVFSALGTERIRGSTPPGNVDEDMLLEKVSDYGCVDFRSIQGYRATVVYADTNGVYQTDGAGTIDLTERGGISTYYRSVLASYAPTWELAGGVFRNFYFLSINSNPTGSAGGTFQDCLVCNLETREWFRFQNFGFRSFTEAAGSGFQEFYAATLNVARVSRVTDIFTPTSANQSDANGTAVTPILETGMHRGFARFNRRWVPAPGLTHWKGLYVSYDMHDATEQDPVLTLSYLTDPAATSYTSLAPTIAESNGYARVRRSWGGSGARGGRIIYELGLKIVQTNSSSDTRIYNIEAEYETIEGSALDT